MQAKHTSRAPGISIGDTAITKAPWLIWTSLGRRLPNDARVFELKGYIQRRRPGGDQEEALRNLERATELDPRNINLIQQTSVSYDNLRRYGDEEAILDRALALEPNDVQTKLTRAFVDLDWKGNTQPVHQLVDELRAEDPAAIPSIADSWLLCALAERDSAAAANALAALGENSVGNETVKYSSRFMEGLVSRMANDGAKAHAAFTAAREQQEKLVRARPDDAGALMGSWFDRRGARAKRGSARSRVGAPPSFFLWKKMRLAERS